MLVTWNPQPGSSGFRIANQYTPDCSLNELILSTGQYGDPAYGCGQIASGLEIHEVPGNHIDMSSTPTCTLWRTSSASAS